MYLMEDAKTPNDVLNYLEYFIPKYNSLSSSDRKKFLQRFYKAYESHLKDLHLKMIDKFMSNVHQKSFSEVVIKKSHSVDNFAYRCYYDKSENKKIWTKKKIVRIPQIAYSRDEKDIFQEVCKQWIDAESPDLLHNRYGPSVVYANGDEEWWIDNKLIKTNHVIYKRMYN